MDKLSIVKPAVDALGEILPIREINVRELATALGLTLTVKDTEFDVNYKTRESEEGVDLTGDVTLHAFHRQVEKDYNFRANVTNIKKRMDEITPDVFTEMIDLIHYASQDVVRVNQEFDKVYAKHHTRLKGKIFGNEEVILPIRVNYFYQDWGDKQYWNISIEIESFGSVFQSLFETQPDGQLVITEEQWIDYITQLYLKIEEHHFFV